MKIDIKLLIKSIITPLLVGGISGILLQQNMSIYETINLPALSPPAILFPIVWTILYILMGVSIYLIKTSGESWADVNKAQSLYTCQLIVNFVWPYIFFGFEWYSLSLILLLVLWVLVIMLICASWSVSKLSAYLNIPYLLWLTFAAYLNLGVWWLNR